MTIQGGDLYGKHLKCIWTGCVMSINRVGVPIITYHGYAQSQCKSYCGVTTTDMKNTVGIHPYDCQLL